jgi:1,2-beta-oligoglucan phosphorylase
LFGKLLEIEYEIKGAGCGVSGVSINGSTVQFDREVNPYRSGAARVPLSDVRRLLASRHSVMRVSVG